MSKKKLFISFEGLEGSGKSTQVGLLGSKLREEGYEIVVGREPGGTRIGEQIRAITHDRGNVELTSMAEAYLMAASRAQYVREIIRPALENGKVVLSDRYVDSSLAYQGYGRELGEQVIFQLNSFAIDGILPTLTIFLDVAAHVGMERRNGSDKVDRLDLQQKEFYHRVYEGYKKIIKKYKHRYVTIDAKGTIEDTAKLVWERVAKVLASSS